MGFPGGSDGTESACNAGDPSLTPGLGRSPGERNGYPFQYSCLENSMDRGVWQATARTCTQGVAGSTATVGGIPTRPYARGLGHALTTELMLSNCGVGEDS